MKTDAKKKLTNEVYSLFAQIRRQFNEEGTNDDSTE